MPIAKVDNINLYYEIHGSGVPLVLILGLSSDISEYGYMIDFFAKHYQVIAFDNRGAGRSDKPHTKYSMDMMAEDVNLLMDQLQIEQAYILGTSMGGRIAMSLALNHPKKIMKLVLVSTGAKRRKKIKMSWPMRLVYPLRSLRLFEGKYPQPRYAFLLQREATLDFDITDRLNEIKTPTLILHGKKDRTVSFDNAKVLNKSIKGSKLITFKGGHLFFVLSERQKFLETVANYLEQ